MEAGIGTDGQSQPDGHSGSGFPAEGITDEVEYLLKPVSLSGVAGSQFRAGFGEDPA
jgi:hypothetical protein